jgi:hypothetical protein
MRKTNKIFLVIVLILVVAFGVGQFFAGLGPVTANPNATPSTSSGQGSSGQATQVIYYAPPALATSTPIEKGSCWTNSIVAPYRPDAWRCAVGNGIHDPCFQIGASTSTLFCDMNPANASDSSAFALKLATPLPVPAIMDEVNPETAWLVELQDGTLCSPFEGTLPPVTEEGETANYDCAPGPLGKDTVIFGSLDSSSSPWIANVGEFSTSTKIFPPPIVSSSSVPIKEIWE